MKLRVAVLALSVGTVMLVGGCSDSRSGDADTSAEVCGADAPAPPFVSVRDPEAAEVAPEEANLTVDVVSGTKPLRVTVRLNGRVALDVTTPGDVCGQAPVKAFHFRVPDDAATRVAMSTDSGQRRSVQTSGDQRRWVVVQPQDGFSLEVTVWDEEPLFG